MNIKPYNIGDTFWYSTWETKGVQDPCPVCAGKKKITIIDGYNEVYTIECEYCRRGFETTGWVVERYERVASVEQVVITGLNIHGNDPDNWHYGIRAWSDDVHVQRMAYHNRLFATQEIAVEVAASEIERLAREEEEKFYKKDKTNKRWSWHLGYYKRELKDAQRKMDYANKKMQWIKSIKDLEIHEGVQFRDRRKHLWTVVGQAISPDKWRAKSEETGQVFTFDEEDVLQGMLENTV